jgi:hypothetical protein
MSFTDRVGRLWEYNEEDKNRTPLIDPTFNQSYDHTDPHLFDPYYLYPKPHLDRDDAFYGDDKDFRRNQEPPLLNLEELKLREQAAIKRTLINTTKTPRHLGFGRLKDTYDDLDGIPYYEHPIHRDYTFDGMVHNFFYTLFLYPVYQFTSTVRPLWSSLKSIMYLHSKRIIDRVVTFCRRKLFRLSKSKLNTHIAAPLYNHLDKYILSYVIHTLSAPFKFTASFAKKIMTDFGGLILHTFPWLEKRPEIRNIPLIENNHSNDHASNQIPDDFVKNKDELNELRQYSLSVAILNHARESISNFTLSEPLLSTGHAFLTFWKPFIEMVENEEDKRLGQLTRHIELYCKADAYEDQINDRLRYEDMLTYKLAQLENIVERMEQNELLSRMSSEFHPYPSYPANLTPLQESEIRLFIRKRKVRSFIKNMGQKKTIFERLKTVLNRLVAFEHETEQLTDKFRELKTDLKELGQFQLHPDLSASFIKWLVLKPIKVYHFLINLPASLGAIPYIINTTSVSDVFPAIYVPDKPIWKNILCRIFNIPLHLTSDFTLFFRTYFAPFLSELFQIFKLLVRFAFNTLTTFLSLPFQLLELPRWLIDPSSRNSIDRPSRSSNTRQRLSTWRNTQNFLAEHNFQHDLPFPMDLYDDDDGDDNDDDDDDDHNDNAEYGDDVDGGNSEDVDEDEDHEEESQVQEVADQDEDLESEYDPKDELKLLSNRNQNRNHLDEPKLTQSELITWSSGVRTNLTSKYEELIDDPHFHERVSEGRAKIDPKRTYRRPKHQLEKIQRYQDKLVQIYGRKGRKDQKGDYYYDEDDDDDEDDETTDDGDECIEKGQNSFDYSPDDRHSNGGYRGDDLGWETDDEYDGDDYDGNDDDFTDDDDDDNDDDDDDNYGVKKREYDPYANFYSIPRSFYVRKVHRKHTRRNYENTLIEIQNGLRQDENLFGTGNYSYNLAALLDFREDQRAAARHEPPMSRPTKNEESYYYIQPLVNLFPPLPSWISPSFILSLVTRTLVYTGKLTSRVLRKGKTFLFGLFTTLRVHWISKPVYNWIIKPVLSVWVRFYESFKSILEHCAIAVTVNLVEWIRDIVRFVNRNPIYTIFDIVTDPKLRLILFGLFLLWFYSREVFNFFDWVYSGRKTDIFLSDDKSDCEPNAIQAYQLLFSHDFPVQPIGTDAQNEATNNDENKKVNGEKVNNENNSNENEIIPPAPSTNNNNALERFRKNLLKNSTTSSTSPIPNPEPPPPYIPNGPDPFTKLGPHSHVPVPNSIIGLHYYLNPNLSRPTGNVVNVDVSSAQTLQEQPDSYHDDDGVVRTDQQSQFREQTATTPPVRIPAHLIQTMLKANRPSRLAGSIRF